MANGNVGKFKYFLDKDSVIMTEISNRKEDKGNTVEDKGEDTVEDKVEDTVKVGDMECLYQEEAGKTVQEITQCKVICSLRNLRTLMANGFVQKSPYNKVGATVIRTGISRLNDLSLKLKNWFYEFNTIKIFFILLLFII